MGLIMTLQYSATVQHSILPFLNGSLGQQVRDGAYQVLSTWDIYCNLFQLVETQLNSSIEMDDTEHDEKH